MTKYLSKILYVLAESKIKLVLLLLVFIFTSVLEALGIGLIGPFLNFASDPESIHEYSVLSKTYYLLNLQSSSQFIFILALGITIVFCIKACFYLLANFYIFQFSFHQKSLLRSRLLKAYLQVPYTFHLNRNTSSYIKNIVIETTKFCGLTLLPFLNTMANLVMVLIILLLLAYTNLLLLALTLLVLLPTFLLFYRLRKKIANWGKKMSLSDEGTIRILNHGLGGIKETRIIGCESYFEQQMEWECKQYEESAVLYNLSQKAPRIIIETILIIFIMLMVSGSQLFFGQNIQEITQVLAVFSIAAIRLIPASGSIISDVGKMQNSSYALDMLCLDLKEIKEKKPDAFSEVSNNAIYTNFKNSKATNFVNHLEIRGITYYYPSASEPAIQDVSLNIKKGQSVAFIGQSGAGKTTLVDVVLGLLKPQEGDILVDNVSIYENLRSWQNIVGYIPQSIFLTDNTIEKNIAFGVSNHLIDVERLHHAVRAAQLTELIGQLPDGIHTPVGERGVRLSGGQSQRIGIARALYHQREILVLDEATSALDNETERLVAEAIESLIGTKTLIIVAHRLSTVEHCDLVYLLDKGRLIKSGSYQEVVSK